MVVGIVVNKLSVPSFVSKKVFLAAISSINFPLRFSSVGWRLSQRVENRLTYEPTIHPLNGTKCFFYNSKYIEASWLLGFLCMIKRSTHRNNNISIYVTIRRTFFWRCFISCMLNVSHVLWATCNDYYVNIIMIMYLCAHYTIEACLIC